MGVCPNCRIDPNIILRSLYCSGLLVQCRDNEINHSGREKLFVINLIMNSPIKIMKDL